MNFVRFFMIVVARSLARIDIFARFIFDLIHSTDLSEQKIARLESYIFSNPQLRKQRKRKNLENKRGEKILRRTAKRRTLRLRSTVVSEEKGKSVVSLAVLFFRFCDANGMRFIPALAFGILDRTNVSNDRIETFHQRVFGTVRLRVIDSTEVSLRMVDDLQAGEFEHDPEMLEDTLKTHSSVHIFVEPGATLPAYLTGPSFEDIQLVIYSFDDISQQIDALGLSERVKLAQLRDRFNDISPEGIELFQKAIDYSETVLSEVISEAIPQVTDFSERATEVFRTCLDGRASLRMVLMSCFKNGMQEVPKGEAIVFLASSDMYINRGWNILKTVMPPENSFVQFAGLKRRGQEEFYKKLCRRLSAPWDVRPVNQDKVASIDLEEINVFFDDAFKDVSDISERYARNIASAFTSKPCTVFAYGERAPAYLDTLKTFGKTLVQQNEAGQCAAPIFLFCAASEAPQSVVKEIMGAADDTDAVFLNLAPFAPTIQSYRLSKKTENELSAFIYSRILGRFELDGFDVADLLLPSIVRVIATQLLWVHASYSFARALSDYLPVDGTFASPSRNWLVRGFCAGLLDGPQGQQPVIDVQSMNILAHPKYRAPMANTFGVIDSTARDIYVDHFGLEDDRIKLIGAPQNDQIHDAAENVSVARVRDELSISDDKKTILFVSQLQPFERMAQIAEPLAELTRDHPDYHLIVRLHPRETPERLAAYKDLIEKSSSAERVTFSKTEDPISLLSISDVCVTIYSNMAREAVMLNVPVVIANYLDWEPPIRLDLEGLAQGSFSPEELKANIIAAMESSETEQLASKSKYLLENRHLVEGRAVTRLMELYYDSLSSLDKQAQPTKPIARQPGDRAALLKDAQRVSLVLTADVALADLPPIFNNSVPTTIFTSRPTSDRGILGKNCVFDQGNYSLENADYFERNVQTANHLSRVCVETIIKETSRAPDLRNLLEKLQDPFWMRSRPRLIREQTSMANIERGIANARDHLLVISSKNLEMINYMIELALKEDEDRHVLVLMVEKDLTWKLLTPEEFAPILTSHLATVEEKNRIRNGDEDPEKIQREDRKVFEKLSRYMRELELTSFNVPEDPRVLVSTDWRLKTVPGTVRPVISQLLGASGCVQVANVRQEDVHAILKDVGHSKENPGNFSVFTPGDFGPKTPFLMEQTLRRYVKICQDALAEEPSYQAASPNTQKLMASNVDIIIRTYLRIICAWYYYCRRFFENGSAVSLGCPGRQWHAEVAHIAAEDADCLSITLQNAYMSAGYTYVKPTGRYVTAIDNWSKDLFIDYYGVEADRVHVVSTPRFDYLKDLRESSDSKAARARLQLPTSDPVVLFAAQVGLEDETDQIISALARIDKLGGQTPEIIVKLHPRSSTEEVRRYTSVAQNSRANHNLKFVTSGDIADYLSASDVVITIYSNVGTEAAIMGKPLIIAKFGELALPMPMDEFGIGYVARSPEALVSGVTNFIEDDAFKAEQAKSQKLYRDANPAMVEGNSLEIICDVVTRAIHANGTVSSNALRQSKDLSVVS